MGWIAAHRKALVAYAGIAVMLLTQLYPHAHWLPYVIAAGVALGVHVTPNAK
jgi:hypothetical protein